MLQLLRNKVLLSLSLSHFTCDFYSGSIPMLLLFAGRSMGLDVTAMGLVGTVYGIFSSLTQPVFGWLGDLKGGRMFVAGGVLVMTVFQLLMGVVNSYPLLMLCAACAGMGSGAFHPQGASGASQAAQRMGQGGALRTAAMSIFMFGGNFGFGTGPLVAGAIGDSLGRAALPLMSLIGFALVPVLWLLLKDAPRPAPGSGKTLLKINPAFGGLGVAALMLVMFARAWTTSSITFFTPTFFTTLRGFEAAQAGLLSSVNLWALAFGTLFGGLFAQRLGDRRVMLASFLLMAPLTYLYWNTSGPLLFLVAAFGGFVSGASWPPLIVLAQELFPKSAGLSSGLSLGFAFAMGYFGQGINSFLAAPERLGLFNSMMLVPVLPLIAFVCAQLLPSKGALQAERAMA